MKWVVLAAALLALAAVAHADVLYFQAGRTVLAWDTATGTRHTLWRAPFGVTDVAVGPGGSMVAFTRTTRVKTRVGFRREVGVYETATQAVRIIPSRAEQNAGPLPAPDGHRVAFQYYPGHDDWKTGLFDRRTGAVTLDVSCGGESPLNACGWAGDSTLVFATLKGFILRDLPRGTFRAVDIPDSSIEYCIPGCKLIQPAGPVSFCMAPDGGNMDADSEGPPMNVFRVEGRSVTRLFHGPEVVRDCFLAGGTLYIGHARFAGKRKPVEALSAYDVASGRMIALRRLGTLVGAQVR
jgi:hypothetical protein